MLNDLPSQVEHLEGTNKALELSICELEQARDDFKEQVAVAAEDIRDLKSSCRNFLAASRKRRRERSGISGL
jgi:hypothetical protein